jgi:hypothetical protein
MSREASRDAEGSTSHIGTISIAFRSAYVDDEDRSAAGRLPDACWKD